MPELQIFSRPYDWAAIDQATQVEGGVILAGVLADEELAVLNQEIDNYLDQHVEQGTPDTGSNSYDNFLGRNTVRLHGLVEKFPSAHKLVGNEEITGWATRMLANKTSSILLNAGELIQINPGEPHQPAHRDTDSWPLPIGEDPVIVNAIVAFDDFTIENGATAVAPGSWRWDPQRRPNSSEFARAVMQRGDAVLFRGDLVHGGGENTSNQPRRGISLSYSVGWLRSVENSYLNVSRETLVGLPATVQALLGYTMHDGTGLGAGMVGLYENGDPRRYVESIQDVESKT